MRKLISKQIHLFISLRTFVVFRTTLDFKGVKIEGFGLEVVGELFGFVEEEGDRDGVVEIIFVVEERVLLRVVEEGVVLVVEEVVCKVPANLLLSVIVFGEEVVEGDLNSEVIFF